MISIKIISNPYKREIIFKSLDNNEYIPITSEDNSDLICDEITHSFFPHKVKEILDFIYSRYSKPSEPIQLFFEGTDDEYQDLKELCSEGYYVNKFILEPQEHYLMNASEILPDIARIFDDMKPLIEDSVRSNEGVLLNSQKFEDAVNKQIIPICVVGNYSSGKSTFINALVGQEILQSGDNPITDCVYKIMRSSNAESGKVCFEYNGLAVEFSLSESSRESGCKLSGAGCRNEDEFILSLLENMRNEYNQPIHVRIHDLLELIEKHKKKRKRDNESSDIGTLIEIKVPFSNEGVLSQSECKYVIFDTPGEGSASNQDHSETLAKQMRSLTNGLIMYITDNKSLDKVEGEELCKKLIQMDGFDDRFTMIIVNKADDADLPKGGFDSDDEEDIKGLTVSRTLRSTRLFYVSSIIGLGSKCNGDFISEKYEDTYDGCIERFSNPEHKRYRSLFRYNIIPEQIKMRCIERSEKIHNRAFANSGLYWIEKEIMTFAETYSPYNKCTQSKRFLDEVIEATSKKIDESTLHFEESKKTLEDKLGENQRACIQTLSQKKDEVWNKLVCEYPENMQQVVNKVNAPISKEQLEQEQSEIEKRIKTEVHYDEQKEKARFFKADDASINDVSGTQAKDSTDTQNLAEPKGFWRSISDGVKDGMQSLSDSFDKKKGLYKVEKEIEGKVTGILFESKKNQYDAAMANIQYELDVASQLYWKNATAVFQQELIKTITNSEGIDEGKKKTLTDIIASYAPLEFVKMADSLFDFEALKQKTFNIRDFVFGDEESSGIYKLNLRKFTSKYNTSMNNAIMMIREKLRNEHVKISYEWAMKLFELLNNNIIEFNPELRKLQSQIDIQAQQISNLMNRKQRLEEYKLEIEQKIGWN